MTSPALYGAVVFAASAGLATFFAPCAFPLLPGYVGYYIQQSESDTPGIPSAAAAAIGSLTALGIIAGLAFALGQRLTSMLPLLEPVVGVGLVGFGLLVLFDRTPTAHVSLPQRPESVLGFGIFGAVYALAAAGCVVPLFLGVVTQAVTLSLPGGVAVLGVYAASVTAPLVGVTLLTSAGVESWRDLGRYAGQIQRVAAGVMIIAGIGQLYLSIVVLDVV
ncbi:cytochrome c biogenesis CcdA family protein [Haloplanus halobius]|uniref:cytochrome c biogenesis CcdA family protein n=1 Tax=Haloplanus halobius TaxID=2934938 RepID=UPI00200F3DCB|nr:cytochrome c biogenesis protein CcdA [Haloplanus sp. XH21]